MNHTMNPPGGKTLPEAPPLHHAIRAALVTLDSGQPLDLVALLTLARLCLEQMGGRRNG